MPSSDRDSGFREVRDAAIAQKWRVEETNGNHYKFMSPDKKVLVIAGGTYKNYHALKNLVARLRRGGFVPPTHMR